MRREVGGLAGIVVVVMVMVVACLVLAVPAAEASFPGRNGLIAFAREGPPFEPKPRGEAAWTLWVVDSRSGRARQLTHVSRRCRRRGWTWGDYQPSYSASGRLLTYFHEDSCDPRIKDGIYVMHADGTQRRLIREMTADEDDIPEYPALSPSGEFLAYDQFLGDTYVMRVDRQAEQRYLSDCPKRGCPLYRYTWQAQPAWSPTGRRLALTLSGIDGEGDAGHIGTIDTRGLNLRLVTRGRGDAMPDWSPTGDRIVFQRERFIRDRFESDVFTAPAHAERFRTPRRLTATRNGFFPVWSPNRRFIAYVRAPDFETGALWIMRAGDGSAQRPLMSGLATDRISWQPRPRPR